MEQAAAVARYAEIHKELPFHDGTFSPTADGWSDKRSADFPYHFNDGVQITVSTEDLTPKDKFLSPLRLFDDPDDESEEGSDGHQA